MNKHCTSIIEINEKSYYYGEICCVYDYYCLLHMLWFVYLCGDVVLITIYFCMMCWYVV